MEVILVFVAEDAEVLAIPEDEAENDPGAEVVVVDPTPPPPFTMVKAPDSGNAPVPPLRGSKTTW